MNEEQFYEKSVFDFEADKDTKQQIENEEYQPTIDDYDAHCCSEHADWYGFCQYCGAAVPGTMAYSNLYGGE